MQGKKNIEYDTEDINVYIYNWQAIQTMNMFYKCTENLKKNTLQFNIHYWFYMQPWIQMY